MNVVHTGTEPLTVALPNQVQVRTLTAHADARGEVTEIFRNDWQAGFKPVQWNAVHSQPGALRGVHVHSDHWDYLVFLNGRTDVALIDLRRGSPSERTPVYLTVGSESLQAIVIPPGVAHAFLTIEPSTHVYAIDQYWDPAAHLAVRWNDPDLGLKWTPEDPLLSALDQEAGSLDQLLRAIEPLQPFDNPPSQQPGI